MHKDFLGNFKADCTLVVNQDIQQLSRLEAELPTDWARLFVGRELSQVLLSVNLVERPRSVQRWLATTLQEKAHAPVICADIDLLFHPSLSLDPLALFNHISRNIKLVILWPGNYSDGILSYAVPEHQHYRFWRNPGGIDIIGVSDALS